MVFPADRTWLSRGYLPPPSRWRRCSEGAATLQLMDDHHHLMMYKFADYQFSNVSRLILNKHDGFPIHGKMASKFVCVTLFFSIRQLINETNENLIRLCALF